MTLEELKARLRGDLGEPSETVLTSDQIERAVVSGINEYSRYRPIKNFDYVTTQDGKATYDLSTKLRIMRVKEVYYSTGPDVWLDSDFAGLSSYELDGRLEGINIFENPSIWLQFTQRVEQFNVIFDGSFEWYGSSKLLRLIPTPGTDGKHVFFIWTQRHTADTIPDEDVDTMLLWSLAVAKEPLLSKMQRGPGQVQGFGQSVTRATTPAELRQEIRDLKKDFDQKLRGGSRVLIG